MISYINFLSRCYRDALCILFVMLLGSFVCSIQAQDSLLALVESNATANNKIKWYLDLSTIYADDLKTDSAIIFAQKAIEIATEEDLKVEVAEAYYALGYVYDLDGQLENALKNYELSRVRYEKLGIKDEVATCMNSKGVAAYFKGDYEAALKHYTKCLDYVEQHSIESVMANTLNNLGVVYRVTNKNREAIEIYHKTLALSKRTNQENMIGTSYHNLGVAYNFESVLDTALTYFDSAVHHYTLIEDWFEVGRIKTAIGEAYYLTNKNYGEARRYMQEGERYLLREEKNQEVLAKLYLLRAQVERDDHHPVKAENYFNKGLALIADTERNELKLDYYQELQIHYDNNNSPNKAYQYLKKYVTLFKEVQSGEKVRAIEELQTQYQTKEKVQQIALLNSENELQETKLQARKQEILLLVIGSLLLLGLALSLFRLFRKVKDQNSIIAKTLEEKDTLLREIHHRVKNNLQVISALLTLQSKHIKNDQAIEALQEGQGRVQSMALIHQDLYQHDNLKGVNTKDYFEKLIESLINTYATVGREIELEFDIEPIILDVDTMIPLGLLVNELTSNALKHAFVQKSKGRIRIALHEIDDQLRLRVEDNGTGVELLQLENKSFGYSLIRSFARRLDAELDIQNNNGLCVEMLIKNYQKAA